MHIDLNSCFATIEQQSNPLLRGKPIAVSAYKTDSGFILAPSVEAKRLGIKMGMRVKEGKEKCPELIVLEPDPWKYRNVHLKLRNLLNGYTDMILPKSIDEFVLDLENSPAMDGWKNNIVGLGQEIKTRIRQEIGEWLTVSIGMATNRYLAKIASNLKKPDGLEWIDAHNHKHIFNNLALTDLCGIKFNNAVRLNRMGIFSVLDFYKASPKNVQLAFHSVVGYRWYLRLRGWEIDDVESDRKSYGNSVSLHKPVTTPKELGPVLMNLTEKMSRRVRKAGYKARGVHLAIRYRNGTYWHKGHTTNTLLYNTCDVYKVAYKLLENSPCKSAVHTLAVTCFGLSKPKYRQLSMLDTPEKKMLLTQALDRIADKWGNFVVVPARMLPAKGVVKDRVAFGGIKELEELLHGV